MDKKIQKKFDLNGDLVKEERNEIIFETAQSYFQTV